MYESWLASTLLFSLIFECRVSVDIGLPALHTKAPICLLPPTSRDEDQKDFRMEKANPVINARLVLPNRLPNPPFPFPAYLPTIEVSGISLNRLLDSSVDEGERLVNICKRTGVFTLIYRIAQRVGSCGECLHSTRYPQKRDVHIINERERYFP